MKRFILLLLIIPICSAQIYEFDAYIDLNEKNEAFVKYMFFVNPKTKEISMPLYFSIKELKSDGGNCNVIAGYQSILQCKPNSTKFNVSFVATGIVSYQKNLNVFSFDIPVTIETSKSIIKLELPYGYGLSDKVILPTSPPITEIGTDGRKIFIKWEFGTKYSDDIIPLRVYYERIENNSTIQRYYALIVTLSVLLVTILIVLYLRVLKKKPELVLSVLNEAERIVVEILQQQPEDEVDQRKIVALSGFSKAKVSRIIQSLEERGVVETERYGRKNKVKLKKKFVKEETEQS
ncbi:MAG: hypothetical protein N3D75_02335 [Candidatus Aenigmarchaeota archaeon]|nr:hypothetical protein [Candidatus Aenigmarchaeota archaeon]